MTTCIKGRALAGEKAVRTLRQEADDWRAKSEGFAAELLAWRSKSESWEATKAQSVRALQSERDRRVVGLNWVMAAAAQLPRTTRAAC